MPEIVNKVQWSESRVKCLRECRRKYYFTYYLSWGGWLDTAEPERQQAYMMKKMTSLPMWQGSIVHDVIQHVIEYRRASNGKANMPLAKAIEEADQALRRGWVESTSKAWKKRPAKCVNLFEHYYDVPIPAGKTEAIKAKVHRCLEVFYASPVGGIINRLRPEDYLALEDFQSFTMNTGEIVTVKIDFGHRHGDQVYLVDWKTGNFTNNVIEQLRTYAMYALKMGWAKQLKQINIVPVFLDTDDPANSAVPLSVDMRLLEQQAQIIRQEYPLLLEAHEKQSDIEAFPCTTDQYGCKYCPFRDMCSGATAEIPPGVTPF